MAKKIRIYDFDDIMDEDNIIFILNILFLTHFFSPNALIRWSSGGRGVHIQTELDLDRYQCEWRKLWSDFYGYDITWLYKKGQKVSPWFTPKEFINYYMPVIVKGLGESDWVKRQKQHLRQKQTLLVPQKELR